MLVDRLFSKTREMVYAFYDFTQEFTLVTIDYNVWKLVLRILGFNGFADKQRHLVARRTNCSWCGGLKRPPFSFTSKTLYSICTCSM